ncbi:uncharacterized protein LOC124940557 [Impatiens glandulifera]|uniref:uncharacterized protein LOC124940557 n=1 Tax=Impatiens glandulifera TaxID=253017 RepID=UPI001FB19E82|nr:uncharacterized protein LOC124940557 [Impatiens glandulifera]
MHHHHLHLISPFILTMAKTLSATSILLVFALSTFWLSNAEKVVLSKAPHTKNEVIIMAEATTMERVNDTHLNKVCHLCEDVTDEILKVLRSKKMQKGIMNILHGTCSLLFNLKPKCMATVNSYGLVFFTMVQIVQPRTICNSVHLCSPNPANSTTFFMSEDKCDVCHYVVGKALTELKYPNKQLEIMMESVLKNSITMKSIEEKQILNSEFAPMILDNTKHFLEAMDLCAMTRACDSRYSSDE